MWLCGASLSAWPWTWWYPLCRLMPHICWSPHLTSVFPSRRRPNLPDTTSLSPPLSAGSTCRTGSPRTSIYNRLPVATTWHQPPSASETRRLPHAAHASKAWLKGKRVTKQRKKGKENSNFSARRVFTLFLFCFRPFHHCHFVFRFFFFVFVLENCECYFRRLFIVWLLTWHFVVSVGTNQLKWDSDCHVVQGVAIIGVSLSAAATPR